ncbi:MAG: amidohydrolase [Robiginitomaculum sp.]|nr:MAG: amidohydrolase [Robiginitomaculum sp.]
MLKTTATAISLLSLAFAAPTWAKTIAITGGKVITNTAQGHIENGTVIIKDGKILSVGVGIAIPDGATRIDASGKWVTPGLFTPLSQVGLVEIAAESSTDDSSASDSEFSVALNGVDGFNPKAEAIAITKIEGMTRIAVTTGAGGNIFSGAGFIANTSGDIADSITKSKAFISVQMGERGARIAGGSRPAAWAYLRNALSEARSYRPGRESEDALLNGPDAMALKPAAEGRMPLLVYVNRASDLMTLIRLHNDQPKLNLVAVGATEGWMVADKLAAAGIPVILEPQNNLPSSFESLGATMTNAARLQKAGVTIAIAQLGEAFNARLAPQQAGDAVANGLSWDAAFAAITSAPAKIFGLGDRLGALSDGMTADVVVWDGDPLELMSSPDHVFIGGEEQTLTSRQTKLRDRYLDLETVKDAPFAYR